MSSDETQSSEPQPVTLVDGTSAMGVPVGFEGPDSGILDFQLEDGTLLKVRFNFENSFRVVDHFLDDGSPMYLLGYSVNLLSNAPDHLKKEGGSDETASS